MNWSAVTGGTSGIAGIPAPRFSGLSFDEPENFVFLSTFALGLASAGYWLLMRSSYGRTLHAIRLDELAAVAAGRHVLQMKLGISAVSGAYAGLGGALYAIFMSFIDPSSFEIHVSVLILTMLVVGGARTLAGSILGPFIILAVPQMLTLLALPPHLIGPLRSLTFGVILVSFMLWLPKGLAGRKI